MSLLNEHQAKYLLIGAYAVIFHGYPRNTGDIDIWIAISPQNAAAVKSVVADFGFDDPSLTTEILMQEWQIVRMGLPPFRIEVTTGISGVDFEKCWERRVDTQIDGIPVHIIGLDDLKTNKAASGRPKGQEDLRHLP